jgi:hypothetical protein
LNFGAGLSLRSRQDRLHDGSTYAQSASFSILERGHCGQVASDWRSSKAWSPRRCSYMTTSQASRITLECFRSWSLLCLWDSGFVGYLQVDFTCNFPILRCLSRSLSLHQLRIVRLVDRTGPSGLGTVDIGSCARLWALQDNPQNDVMPARECCPSTWLQLCLRPASHLECCSWRAASGRLNESTAHRRSARAASVSSMVPMESFTAIRPTHTCLKADRDML